MVKAREAKENLTLHDSAPIVATLPVFSHIQFNIYSDRHNTLSSSAKSPTSPNRMFIDWME